MKTMTLALLAALALSTSALAAGGGHSHKGPNGGALIDVTGGHAELVDTPTEIALYFSDEDGKPQSAKGASGKATVMSGGKTETLVLSPATPEKLTAPSRSRSPRATRSSSRPRQRTGARSRAATSRSSGMRAGQTGPHRNLPGNRSHSRSGKPTMSLI